MLFLFFILLPIAEIFVLIQVGREFGIVNTLFALLASAVLGIGLTRSQGIYILRKLQATAARGEIPSREAMHGILIFIGGVLFVIPGFITDIFGLICVVPGPRHLLVKYLSHRLKKASPFTGPGFRVFTNSTFGGFRSSSSGFQNPFGDSSERNVSPIELNEGAQVIDVTAVSINDNEKKNPDEH